MNRRNFIKGFLTTATVAALAPLPALAELPVSGAKFLTLEEMLQECLSDFRGQLISNITSQQVYWSRIKPTILNNEAMEDFFLKPVGRSDLMVIR